MTPASLWVRLGSWIRPFARDEDLPELARTENHLSPQRPARPPADAQRSLFRTRRDDVIEHMQTGYDNVLDLVESIQEHLVRQNERSDKVVESLSDLASGVRDLPQAARRHNDTLNKVVGQMEVSNSHAQVMIGALRDWPNASAAQRQALESIDEHLRYSADATRGLTQRLHALDDTVSTLGRAAGEQIQTLKAMQRAAGQQEAQLVKLLTAHTRRFVMLFGLGALMSALALAAATTVLLG